VPPAPEDDATRLGTYRVLRRLGDTPVGDVLLGADGFGRSVVLFVVHPALAATAGFRERFGREARAAAAAPPWFVATVVDLDVAAERPWLVTAQVPGSTLQSFVDERGPLGEAGTTALATRLAAGLVALHADGLVHGDLSPSAIVLAEDGPRLTGFGLARAAGPGYGTPGYQAPEQAAAAPAADPAATEVVRPVQVTGESEVRDPAAPDPAVDMFAFGCVLGFAATGRSPFAAGSAQETLRAVAKTEPDLATLAEPVRSAALACLHKDPRRRPSAAQVAAMLDTDGAATALMPQPTPEHPPAGPYGAPPSATLVGAPPAVVGGPPWGGPPWGGPVQPPPERRRGPLVAAIAVAALLVLAVVAVVALTARVGGKPSAAGSSAPAPSGTSSGTVDPGTGATLVDAGQFGADGPRFATPSRNISCQMTDPSSTSAGTARCDVAQHTWQIGPKPADCAGEYGAGAAVSGTGKGELTCLTDTVADPGLQLLQYGQAVSYGGIVCDSQETGVRCVNAASGHGFRVSRASYDLF
jgi:hypothetical protein